MSVEKLVKEFSPEVIRAFVQKNADYYLAKWEAMARSGSKVSWNWPAFFFGVFWMGYRKMYLYAAIVVVLSLLSDLPKVGPLVTLVLWFGVAAFANYIYGTFTYNKLTELKVQAKDEDELRQLAAAKGGTSVLGVIIVGFIVLFISLIGAAVLYRGG